MFCCIYGKSSTQTETQKNIYLYIDIFSLSVNYGFEIFWNTIYNNK